MKKFFGNLCCWKNSNREEGNVEMEYCKIEASGSDIITNPCRLEGSLIRSIETAFSSPAPTTTIEMDEPIAHSYSMRNDEETDLDFELQKENLQKLMDYLAVSSRPMKNREDKGHTSPDNLRSPVWRTPPTSPLEGMVKNPIAEYKSVSPLPKSSIYNKDLKSCKHPRAFQAVAEVHKKMDGTPAESERELKWKRFHNAMKAKQGLRRSSDAPNAPLLVPPLRRESDADVGRRLAAFRPVKQGSACQPEKQHPLYD